MDVEQFANIKELYAEILSIGIPVLIRGGLIKDYIDINEKSTILRGKIDLHSSIKQTALVDRKLNVIYDEFSEDHLFNQIIKATLVYLHLSMQIRKKHRKKFLNYLAYFSNVSDIKLSLSVWKNVHYNRQNIRYQFIVDICRFIYEELLLAEDLQIVGRQHFQDNQRLASLFEKFIFAFYKRETNFAVSRPQIKWSVDNDFREALPIMQTDLVLREDNITLIIDTKFYSKNMIARFENSSDKYISSNLYQIFAYVNNWQAGVDEVVGGMLLYARTTAMNQPNHRYKVKGKTIITASIDLNQDFNGIKKDLILVVNDYFNKYGKKKGMLKMKVLLLNGSPNAKGCTYTGLLEIANELNQKGVETEIIQIGKKPIIGCTACGSCRQTQRCAFNEDGVNDFLDKVSGVDGIVFGTPVHYAGVSGAVKSFMDRAFFTNAALFRGKPGAIIASCRRGGASAALDGLSKYLAYAEMPIVSGRYWNMIHGNTPEQVAQDLEGMENLRFLGRNMAWLLRCIEAGAAAGIEMPEYETKTWTNFIR